MVQLKVGQVIPIDGLKSGVKNGKTWAYMPIKAKKGYDRITLWISNAADIEPEWTQIEITAIEECRLTAYKDNGGRFYTQYQCVARVKSSKGYVQYTSDEDLDSIFG